MKYIPYGNHNITEEDIGAVVKIMRSKNLTQGPAVEAFENAICKEVKSEHAIATNSATSALHIACKALGLKKGDWLWTTSITFVASANCGIYCDAEVDFVDIDPKNGLMDTECLEVKLKIAETKGLLPKIVVPVHLSGSSCAMERIYQLSIKFGFKVVEDASHAIGGSYKSMPIGNCKYSDVTVFSFHPVKIITTGEGGAATTNNKELAIKMRELRTHGITRDREKYKDKRRKPWEYEQQDLGYNYRMNDIQAALGTSQLKRLEKIITKRNSLLANYKELLKNDPVDLLEIPRECMSAVHLAIILIRDSSERKHIDLFEHMRKHGIGVQVHYAPVHKQPFYRDRYNYSSETLKGTEIYSKSAISIPLFPELSLKQQKYVVKVIIKGIGI